MLRGDKHVDIPIDLGPDTFADADAESDWRRDRRNTDLRGALSASRRGDRRKRVWNGAHQGQLNEDRQLELAIRLSAEEHQTRLLLKSKDHTDELLHLASGGVPRGRKSGGVRFRTPTPPPAKEASSPPTRAGRRQKSKQRIQPEDRKLKQLLKTIRKHRVSKEPLDADFPDDSDAEDKERGNLQLSRSKAFIVHCQSGVWENMKNKEKTTDMGWIQSHCLPQAALIYFKNEFSRENQKREAGTPVTLEPDHLNTTLVKGMVSALYTDLMLGHSPGREFMPLVMTEDSINGVPSFLPHPTSSSGNQRLSSSDQGFKPCVFYTNYTLQGYDLYYPLAVYGLLCRAGKLEYASLRETLSGVLQKNPASLTGERDITDSFYTLLDGAQRHFDLIRKSMAPFVPPRERVDRNRMVKNEESLVSGSALSEMTQRMKKNGIITFDKFGRAEYTSDAWKRSHIRAKCMRLRRILAIFCEQLRDLQPLYRKAMGVGRRLLWDYMASDMERISDPLTCAIFLLVQRDFMNKDAVDHSDLIASTLKSVARNNPQWKDLTVLRADSFLAKQITRAEEQWKTVFKGFKKSRSYLKRVMESKNALQSMQEIEENELSQGIDHLIMGLQQAGCMNVEDCMNSNQDEDLMLMHAKLCFTLHSYYTMLRRNTTQWLSLFLCSGKRESRRNASLSVNLLHESLYTLFLHKAVDLNTPFVLEPSIFIQVSEDAQTIILLFDASYRSVAQEAVTPRYRQLRSVLGSDDVDTTDKKRLNTTGYQTAARFVVRKTPRSVESLFGQRMMDADHTLLQRLEAKGSYHLAIQRLERQLQRLALLAYRQDVLKCMKYHEEQGGLRGGAPGVNDSGSVNPPPEDASLSEVDSNEPQVNVVDGDVSNTTLGSNVSLLSAPPRLPFTMRVKESKALVLGADYSKADQYLWTQLDTHYIGLAQADPNVIPPEPAPKFNPFASLDFSDYYNPEKQQQILESLGGDSRRFETFAVDQSAFNVVQHPVKMAEFVFTATNNMTPRLLIPKSLGKTFSGYPIWSQEMEKVTNEENQEMIYRPKLHDYAFVKYFSDKGYVRQRDVSFRAKLNLDTGDQSDRVYEEWQFGRQTRGRGKQREVQIAGEEEKKKTNYGDQKKGQGASSRPATRLNEKATLVNTGNATPGRVAKASVSSREKTPFHPKVKKPGRGSLGFAVSPIPVQEDGYESEALESDVDQSLAKSDQLLVDADQSLADADSALADVDQSLSDLGLAPNAGYTGFKELKKKYSKEEEDRRAAASANTSNTSDKPGEPSVVDAMSDEEEQSFLAHLDSAATLPYGESAAAASAPSSGGAASTVPYGASVEVVGNGRDLSVHPRVMLQKKPTTPRRSTRRTKPVDRFNPSNKK